MEPLGHAKAELEETATHGVQMFGFGPNPGDAPPPTEAEQGLVRTIRMIDDHRHARTREFLA